MPVSGQGLSYHVDLVMCIDATGSMKPIIEVVKKNAISFHKQLSTKLEEEGKRVEQLRLKVITFRDYADANPKPMLESDFFTLPASNDAFESFVNGIVADGGGDEAENALEAVSFAIKSDWVKTGSKRRHVIMVFTDAPALKLSDRASSPGYPAGMPKDLAELGDIWSGAVQSASMDSLAQRMIIFAPNAFPWTDIASGWNKVWHEASAAGAGLDTVNMDTAIRLLVNSISDTSI